MTVLAALGQALLNAAVASGAPHDEHYIAGAPGWAKRCPAIVVHLEAVDMEQPTRSGMPTGCAVVPVAEFHVTYVRDCYPAIGTTWDGTVDQPAADALTDWTKDALAGVDQVVNAVLDFACSDTIADYGASAEVGLRVTPGGPQGGKVWWSLPVRVALVGNPAWTG